MIKIKFSVMMETSDGWQKRLDGFIRALKESQYWSVDGEIRIPSYSHLDNLFELARKYEIAVCIHS